MNGQEQRKRSVVEGRERQCHGQEVEPGKISAQHEPRLRQHQHRAGERRHGLRCEQEERHHQLREEVAQDLDPMQGFGQVMKKPAERIGHRLGLVVVVEAGQVAPAAIAAQLDHPGAELDAEHEPAKQQDERPRGDRRPGAEEDGQEPGFEEERLPAERVKDLAHVDDRLVQDPEREPDEDREPRRRHIGKASHHGEAEHEATPCHSQQQPVRVAEVEEARGLEKGHPAQEQRHRQQSLFAEQRPELVDGDQERDAVHDPQRSLDDESRQPVIGRLEPIHVSAAGIARRRGPHSRRTFRGRLHLAESRLSR